MQKEGIVNLKISKDPTSKQRTNVVQEVWCGLFMLVVVGVLKTNKPNPSS